MATQDDYKKAIIAAHNKGDFEAAKMFAGRLQTLQAAEPETNLLQDAVGAVETGAALISGAVAEPISGLAGIAQSLNPFADEGAGADAVKSTQEALTYQPRTDAGKSMQQGIGEALKPIGDAIQGAEKYLGDKTFDATGSPALAAAATTIPTLAGELVGVAAGRGAVRSADRAVDTAEAGVRRADDLVAGRAVDDALADDVSTLTAKNNDQQIIEMMDLDPQFFRDMDELGISAEPLSAFASGNPQFVDIVGTLRAVPGSVLDVQALKFMDETANAANDLIVRYGGDLDKPAISEKFKSDSLAANDAAYDAESLAWDSLRENMPLTTRVMPSNTKAFLDEKIAELGGVNELPAELKKVYKAISKEGGVTYGLMDLFRKEFGAATRSKSGRFSDTETGLAKAMYGRLINDAEDLANSLDDGSGNLVNSMKVANQMTIKRKLVEDNLKALYGKDLNKSLGNVVSGAIKGLEKGKVDEFLDTFKKIPEGMRQDVAMSFMNDAFRGAAAGQQALSPTQFTKWYDNINASPRAKAALYSVLPTDSKKSIEALYRVSKGISAVQGRTIRTGRIDSLFNPDTGIVRKLIGRAATATSSLVPGGAVAADAFGQFIAQNTNSAKRASEMMASPKFQDLVRNAVSEGYVQGAAATKKLEAAQDRLIKTQTYKKWADSLGQGNRGALTGGLLPYLFKEEDESGESVESNAEESAQAR